MSRNFKISFDLIARLEQKTKKSRSLSKSKEKELGLSHNTSTLKKDLTITNHNLPISVLTKPRHLQSNFSCKFKQDGDWINSNNEVNNKSISNTLTQGKATEGSKVVRGESQNKKNIIFKSGFIPFSKLIKSNNGNNFNKKKLYISTDNCKGNTVVQSIDRNKQALKQGKANVKTNGNIRSKIANLTSSTNSPERAYPSLVTSPNQRTMMNTENDSYFINNFSLSTKKAAKPSENEKSVDVEVNKKSNDQISDQIKKEEISNKLAEKEKVIKELEDSLENKDKCIKDLEVMLNDLKAIVSEGNTHHPGNEEEMDDEMQKYSFKQMVRNIRMLTGENKALRETIKKLEKDLAIAQEKEIKIMHLLYTLNKKGIPIESMIDNEREKENNNANRIERKNNDVQSFLNQSSESSRFLPLTLDPPPKYSQKPAQMPMLKLKHINSKYNLEYNSPIGMNDLNECNNNNINNNNNEIEDEEYSQTSSSKGNMITNTPTNINTNANTQTKVNTNGQQYSNTENTESNAFCTLEVRPSSYTSKNANATDKKSHMTQVPMENKSQIGNKIYNRLQTVLKESLKSQITNALKSKVSSNYPRSLNKNKSETEKKFIN